MASRELRALIPVEALVLVVLVVAPLPHTLPVALPLLVVATASRWLRGRSWGAVMHSPRTMLGGLIVGIVALSVAAPLFGAFRVTAVEWWLVPAANEDVARLALSIAFSIVTAIALELALRGWLVERIWELSPGPPTLPIATTAAVEALLLGGPVTSMIGAALFGIGLGMLYVGAGRSVVAPMAARATFAAGAIIYEAVRNSGV